MAILNLSRRRYFFRGIYVACALVAGAAVTLLVGIGLFYDGHCRGVLPEISSTTSCSLWEYGSKMLELVFVLGAGYWPVTLSLLTLPLLVGFAIDRLERGAGT